MHYVNWFRVGCVMIFIISLYWTWFQQSKSFFVVLWSELYLICFIWRAQRSGVVYWSLSSFLHCLIISCKSPCRLKPTLKLWPLVIDLFMMWTWISYSLSYSQNSLMCVVEMAACSALNYILKVRNVFCIARYVEVWFGMATFYPATIAPAFVSDLWFLVFPPLPRVLILGYTK